MKSFNTPKAIADAGIKLYEDRFKKVFESSHRGQFVAIDVVHEVATLGASPSEALAKAKEKHADGVFYLIRVGFPSAYEFGVARENADPDWVY
jgi:hypothetical protein